ncbi:MAG: preprotein translocase subunit SecD [Candidatus Nanohaloarchaea archaeon]|jgi:preprotein translocase subunit SecD
MEMKELMKEWRMWVLFLALGASLFLLNPHYETVDGETTIATGINQGLDLEGGTRILLGVQSNNTSEAQANQIGTILEQRISAFGLTQTSVRTVRLGDEYRIQVEVASTNQTELRELISQEGNFQARMPLTVADEQQFSIENTYNFQYENSVINVNNNTYQPGDEFRLDNADFIYVNNTEDAANIQVVAYDGEDVQQVLTSQSRVSQSQGGYSFNFPVVLSSEAAERVRNIAENYPTTTVGGQPYLGKISGTGAAQLMLFVDGQQQSALNMASVFKTQVVTQPSINGGGETAAQARADMEELQAILQSGKLPAPVRIDSISTISSSLGNQFMTAAIISIIMSLVAVGGLIYIRYNNAKLAIPIVITGSSEVFILLGSFFSTIITLDLASIAGIIAAVGTGVDDQIIITDESGRDIVRDWKKRLKRAFFVIFTSAASTIGAMMPIVSPSISNMAIGAAGLGLIGYTLYSNRTRPHYFAIGAMAIAVSAFAFQLSPSSFALQSVRGFAVTTILGVLVGISITRPAYAKMLEYMEEK